MRWPEDASATAGDGSDDDDEGSSPRGGRAESAAFWREQLSLLHVSSFPFPVPIVHRWILHLCSSRAAF